MAILPRPSAPVPSFGEGPGEEGQMYRELQGTRIRRRSRATTPPRQTVITINVFSLDYVMCVVGGSREGKRQTDEGRDVRGEGGGRDQLDDRGSESDGVGKGDEEGDSQRQDGREDSHRRPEHAALLVPTK